MKEDGIREFMLAAIHFKHNLLDETKAISMPEKKRKKPL